MPVREEVGACQITIGRTVIPYQVVASHDARRTRIVVDVRGMRVVVPVGEDAHGRAARFVNNHRKWVYLAWRRAPAADEHAQRFLSGARVSYRGRRLRLTILAGATKQAAVECRSRFQVTLPRLVWASPKREQAAASAVSSWLESRLLEDAGRLAHKFSATLGVTVKGIRAVKMRRLWASCGRDGIVRLNPSLIELPVRILEYVLAHEVAHLVHRNHGARFWDVVTRLCPDHQRLEVQLKVIEGSRHTKRVPCRL